MLLDLFLGIKWVTKIQVEPLILNELTFKSQRRILPHSLRNVIRFIFGNKVGDQDTS